MKKTTWLLSALFWGSTLLATTLATPVVADTNAGPGNATTARMSMVRTKIVRFCRMRMVVT